MSSIIGKEYKNNSTKEVIKVSSIEGNIAVLENDQRISIERLLDKSHYVDNSVKPKDTKINESNMTQDNSRKNNDEAVDVDSFNDGFYKQLHTEISNIEGNEPNNGNVGDSGTEIGNMVNPVVSHREEGTEDMLKGSNVYDDGKDSGNDKQYDEMLKKAQDNQKTLKSKIERQSNSVGGKIEGIETTPFTPNRNLEGVVHEDRDSDVNIVDSVGVDNVGGSGNHRLAKDRVSNDINPMFKKMKRTNDIKLKIDIEETIPSKDLLKMLEEGFEDSVLDFLTEDIASKVLFNDVIKKQIKKRLHEYVYGSSKKTTSKSKSKTKPKSKPKKTTPKEIDKSAENKTNDTK